MSKKVYVALVIQRRRRSYSLETKYWFILTLLHAFEEFVCLKDVVFDVDGNYIDLKIDVPGIKWTAALAAFDMKENVSVKVVPGYWSLLLFLEPAEVEFRSVSNGGSRFFYFKSVSQSIRRGLDKLVFWAKRFRSRETQNEI